MQRTVAGTVTRLVGRVGRADRTGQGLLGAWFDIPRLQCARSHTCLAACRLRPSHTAEPCTAPVQFRRATNDATRAHAGTTRTDTRHAARTTCCSSPSNLVRWPSALSPPLPVPVPVLAAVLCVHCHDGNTLRPRPLDRLTTCAVSDSAAQAKVQSARHVCKHHRRSNTGGE